MVSSVNRPCFAMKIMDKIILGCFHKRKKDVFLALMPLELDVQPTFCWFSYTNEPNVVTDQWIIMLYLQTDKSIK